MCMHARTHTVHSMHGDLQSSVSSAHKQLCGMHRHTHGHAHTHTQTLHLMRGKRRERGRRRLKSRTEQQHGFVDVRRLLLRLSDSQCPQALFVVVRKSACLFRIFYVIGQKNLREKKNALLFHSLGTTKILLLKQISVKK